MRRTIIQSSALAIILLTMACEASLTEAELARARAAREYDCPKQKIHVKWLSEGPKQPEHDYQIYKVAACGTIVTYACDSFNQTCVKESDDRSR